MPNGVGDSLETFQIMIRYRFGVEGGHRRLVRILTDESRREGALSGDILADPGDCGLSLMFE